MFLFSITRPLFVDSVHDVYHVFIMLTFFRLSMQIVALATHVFAIRSTVLMYHSSKVAGGNSPAQKRLQRPLASLVEKKKAS